MTSPGIDAGDEPVTPAGRLFLLPEMEQIIHCAVGLHRSPDAASMRTAIANSPMTAHPRFRSLLVRDSSGRQRWRRTEIDIDRHIIVAGDDAGDGEEVNSEQVVNDYIAELSVSTPLSRDKPLWEFHVLGAHRCVVMRLHHALGDGISLMSLFLACCRSAADPDRLPEIKTSGGRRDGEGGGRGSMGRKLWTLLRVLWFTLVYALEFIGRSLWVSDRKTVLSGGDGVELWPRKLATARFRLEDMKAVKRALPHLTINDVVFGILSCGLSRYLDVKSSRALQEGLQITGLAMVNLRKQPGLQELSELMKSSNTGSSWGNKFGMFLLPVYYYYYHNNNNTAGADPLEYLKRAKAMLDRKKLSFEAQLSYMLGDLAMSCLGPKVACMLNYRVICNTTFTFSNVVGPQEEITMEGNPVTYLRVNSSSLPHAITMHMLSYAGRVDMQILVAKDIIPDPQCLAKCLEEALLDLKEAAAATTRS